MQTFIKNNRLFILLSLIVFIGGFLRFYKLDWASGLFTHPDEYHIVGSVSQLSFPNQMHPHFFSYGTVTIYLIYFTQQILQILNHLSLIINPFLAGRFYSAFFSTLTIFVVYKLCITFMKKNFALLAILLVALTPGLIQQAHFATPESAQTFFLFSSLFFMIKFVKQSKILFLVLACVFLGFALGVKISSIVFLLPLITVIIIQSYPKNLSFKTPILFIKHALKTLLKFTGLTLTSIIITTATFSLVAPYVFLDFPAFRGNFEYEGGLAIGKFPVFYTRPFIDTVPVIFQIEKIFPYTLGPAILIFGILGFFLIVVKHLGWWHGKIHLRGVTSSHLGGDRKGSSEVKFRWEMLLLITIAFLSLFLPNAFLFAKWTRFISPTFPFFAIFAVFLLQELKRFRILFYSLLVILILATSFWTTAFFSIYTNPDVRITASEWLESNAKQGSSFLVEGGNMVDLPLRGNFQRMSLDFYNLENDPMVRARIVEALYTSDYFLVQSRRVFMNHQRLRRLYPKTSRFYDALFNGKLGFTKVKTFSSYPKLEVGGWKLEVADEGAEETWSVFDHPVIRIFKKNKQISQDQYRYIIDGGKL